MYCGHFAGTRIVASKCKTTERLVSDENNILSEDDARNLESERSRSEPFSVAGDDPAGRTRPLTRKPPVTSPGFGGVPAQVGSTLDGREEHRR